MSERGVFAVDRGIWDHPVFANEPFTEREAWQWLISEASFRPRTRKVGTALFQLERGQLVVSIRFLAERWEWSKSKVDRFLQRLKQGISGRGGRPKNLEKPTSKTGAMIETRTEHGMTVITVCNYAKYQRVSLPDETDSGTVDGTVAGQQRDKLENIKNIESLSRSVAKRRDPVKVLRFDDEFWPNYPRRKGSNPKQEARKLYEQAIKLGTDEQAIIDGAKAYRAELCSQGKEGSEYVAQAKTWLHKRRWTDYAPGAGTTGTNPAPITVSPNVSPLLRGIVAAHDEDWGKWMNGYLRQPAHTRAWLGPGAPPGEPGCEVPAEIQRKHGFTPVPWIRRSDGKHFGAA